LGSSLGRASAVEGLQAIADEYDLKLMFDAAHALAVHIKDK